MLISLFLAKVIGLYLLIVSVAMLVNQKGFRSMMNEMIANSAVFTISAIIALIIGILLVVSHNFWVFDWRLLITLIAWLTLFKGLFRVFCPQGAIAAAKKFQKPAAYYISAIITLILGLVLVYFGFFGY